METSDHERQVLRDAAERLEVTLIPALLKVAFSYCARGLTPPELAALKRVDLLEVLAELSDALQQGTTVLASVTGAALTQAVAGPGLREALRAGETALAQSAHELAQLYDACAPLLQQEKVLLQQAADYENLQRRYTELARLAALTLHSDELSAQVEELSQRLARGGQEATDWERRTEDTARSLITLSTATLASLEPRVQQALAEADRLENERHIAVLRLQDAQTQARRADADLRKLNNELHPHLEANRAVANALPKSSAPHALLDQAERLLQQADEALRRALKSRADAQPLAKLPLVERQHGHP